MKIFYYIPGMRTDGHAIENLSLGGSETAGLSIATELAKQGHHVTVFSNTPEPSVWQGMRIIPIGEQSEQYPLGKLYEETITVEPHDVLVVQRVPRPFNRLTASKLRFYSMHDLARKRTTSALKSVAWNTDKVLGVSDFHCKQISETHELPDGYTHVIRNGVDLSLFEKEPSWDRKKRGKKLIYISRPERGLINLVKPDGIMERLYKIDPDITLSVCFYDNTTPEMESHYRALFARCHELSNVELLGSLNKKVLAEALRDSALLVYPVIPEAEHEETSCIAVMEAQAAGTPVVTCRNGAIPETMGDGVDERGILINYLKDGSVDIEFFVEHIKVILREDEKWESMAKACWNYRENYSWEKPAQELIELARGTLRSYSDNAPGLAKHLLYQADAILASEVIKNANLNGNNPIKHKLQLFNFLTSKNSFEKHYARSAELIHQYNKDNLYPKEAVLGHYEAVLPMLEALHQRGGGTVLDYGGGVGIQTLMLAEKYPSIHFTHVDINYQNVNSCIEEIGKRKINNVLSFEADWPEKINNRFNIVMALEVIEHIREEPWEFSEALENLTMENGQVILTFPSSAPNVHPRAKDEEERMEHVRYIEHSDSVELWGDKPAFQMNYFRMPSKSAYGYPVSGAIASWRKSENKAKQINYKRKLQEQSPIQTLSLCMIIKWDEPAIKRALRSVAIITDEAILGIDFTGCGNSKQELKRLKQLAVNALPDSVCNVFPLTKIPLIDGFGPARNETIEAATCDWILWMDADEEFIYPEKLPKYLRSNAYIAYAVAHHHYSSEPAEVLKSDFPSRIFRRGKLKFYGLVHEHPAYGPNEPPKDVMVLTENIAISHTGYVNDEIRTKRFHRNWPLMKADREKYPTRALGKYLFARDLMHCCRYELQKTGGQINDDILKWAQEAVDLYRELVKEKEIRLILETLLYVTEAAFILTNNNAIKMKFSFGAEKQGFGLSPIFLDGDILGGFVDKQDVIDLTKLLVEEKLNFYEGKYV